MDRMSEPTTEEPMEHGAPHPSAIDPDPDETWPSDWPWDNEE